MSKKKYYLTIDTETATLPFANQMCKSSEQKQKIAIAKPLVYDIGWCITDRQGNITQKRNFLVQEIFFNQQVFDTAYYKDKRNLYFQKLADKTIQVAPWDEIINILISDLQTVDIATAFNACFDFKKAIPFTEKYIYHLYNNDLDKWEYYQEKQCQSILAGKANLKNDEYLEPYFNLRGQSFPIVDLWGLACERLINNIRYKKYCLDNEYLTKSMIYFKTSAENVFQYLSKQYDFIEEHTALSDTLVEAVILTKILRKGKINPCIVPFPFKLLGTTTDFVKNQTQYLETVYQNLTKYFDENNGRDKTHISYWSQIHSEIQELEKINF